MILTVYQVMVKINWTLRRTILLMKTLVALLIVIVSFLGILDAGYITYEKVKGVIPPCSPGFACGTVLESSYASIGPVPLSVLGLFFYATVFIFAILNFVEISHVKIFGLKLHTHDILLSLSIFGVGFSGYLIFIMAVVLKAWCLYCLISALLCAANFFLNAIQWRLRRNECHKECSRPRAQTIHWLYRNWLKRIFFLFDAEQVHNFMVSMGETLGATSLGRALSAWFFKYSSPSLGKTVDGINFANPVGLAAGFDYEASLTQVLPAVGFGFMTIGTVTYGAYEGNAAPRLGRFPKSKALLVNKGFKSQGTNAVIRKLTGMHFEIPVGISIGSTNRAFESEAEQIEDIIKSFRLFEKSSVANEYYELNISCPNTKGGQPFTSKERLEALLAKLEKLHIKKPIYIKMPIDLGEKDTLVLLKVAKKYTISGVIFGNLTKDHKNPDVNPEDRKVWATKPGNLSGKPTWKRSNALIRMTRKHFGKRFTIIGTGGVFSGKDASEKMKAGADLVQLITGMIFEGPQLVGQINQHLDNQKTKK